MKKLIYFLILFVSLSFFAQTKSFYDDFLYNNNNWYTVSNCQESEYTNNNLIIRQVRKKSGFSSGSWVHNTRIDQTKDFKISSNMTLKSGVIGNGVVWNFIDGKNNYRFLITDRNGRYAIYKIEDGKPTAIKAWGDSAHINKKFASNMLSVEKRGNRTYFYINGYEVHNDYIPYDSNPKQVGVFLGEGSTSNKLEVEDFRLDYSGTNNGESGRRSDGDRAPGSVKN